MILSRYDVIFSLKQDFSPLDRDSMESQLANIILFHRKRSGLTQLELAEMADVGKNMVYELENGKQSVQLDNLLRILHVLNIELIFQSPLRESFFKEFPDADS